MSESQAAMSEANSAGARTSENPSPLAAPLGPMTLRERAERLQDLISPIVGVFIGQYLFGALPNSPWWGIAVIAMSALLFVLRIRKNMPRFMADVGQGILGILVILPIVLDADNWKAAAPPWELIALWVAGCLLVGVVAVRQKSSALQLGLEGDVRFDRWDLIIVAILFVAALFVRIPFLETIPRYINGDEPTMAQLAVNTLIGRSNDPFNTGWSTHPTLQFFIYGLFIRVFGNTFFAMRLPSTLVGSLGVLALYLLVRVTYGRRVAVIAGCLGVVANTALQFSRMGINNITDPLFFALVVALLWLAGRSGKPIYFVLAGATTGLSLYYYFGDRAVPFVVAVQLVAWVLVDARGVWRARYLILTMILMAVVVSGPLLGTWLRQPSGFTEHLVLTVPFSDKLTQEAANNPLGVWGSLAQRVVDTITVFNVEPDHGAFYGPGQALLHPIDTPFFLLGLVLLATQWRRPLTQGLLGWIAVVLFLGSILIVEPATFHRILGVLPAGILIVALGVDTLLEILKKSFVIPQRMAFAILAGVLVVLMAADLQFYFGVFAPRPLTAPPFEQATNIAAMEYEHLHGDAQFVLISQSVINDQGQINNSDIEFVAGDAFIGGTLERLDELDTNQAIYFYVYRDKLDELPALQERFPGGTIQEYPQDPDGELLMTRYVVPSGAAQK